MEYEVNGSVTGPAAAYLLPMGPDNEALMRSGIDYAYVSLGLDLICVAVSDFLANEICDFLNDKFPDPHEEEEEEDS